MAVAELAGPKIARGAVASHESRSARAKEKRSSHGLLPSEREELNHHWAGHEAEIGFHSLQGACQDKFLRAPPDDGVQGKIIEQLERIGGHYEREEFVALMSSDWSATPYETRRALKTLKLRGYVRLDVITATRRKRSDSGESVEVTEPTEMVHLVQRLDRTAPQLLTREERWARVDAEVEAAGRWTEIKCNESAFVPARGGGEGLTMDVDVESFERELARERAVALARASRARIRAAADGRPVRTKRRPLLDSRPDPAVRRLQRLTVEQRCMIERVYGYSAPPRYLPDYGGTIDLARIVEFTPAVEKRRRAMVDELVAKRVAALEAEHGRQLGVLRGAAFRLAEERTEAPPPKPKWASMSKLERTAYMRAAGDRAKHLRELRAIVRAGVWDPPSEARVRAALDATVTVAHVFDAVLYAAPAEKFARKRWQDERVAFIAATTRQGSDLLEWLTEAYRAAGHRGVGLLERLADGAFPGAGHHREDGGNGGA